MKNAMRYELIINQAMRSAMNYDEPDEQIEEFIRFLGKHIGSDRIYIFEDDVERHVTNNTYEWCKDGVEPSIDMLQDVDMDVVAWWYEEFDKGNSIMVDDVESIKEGHESAYEMLKEQNITCVAVSPLRYKDSVRGFFGVDNPPLDDADALSMFLDMIGTFLVLLVKQRNAVAKANEEAKMNSYSALAGVYLSMHMIEMATGEVRVIKASPFIIDSMYEAEKLYFPNQIRHVMDRLANEKYKDSVFEFTDISTLNDRMKGRNTISHEFLGNVSGWCKERFIRVDDNEDGTLNHVIYAVEVIDEEKRRENRLLYLSETDLMTGIRNRGSGESEIKKHIDNGVYGMFCMLDCDKFKSINDTYGHAVGDEVIIAVAKALQSECGKDDILLRLGGDEFAMYFPQLIDRMKAEIITEAILNSIRKIFIPELCGTKIEVSMGAAFYMAGDDVDFEKIYRNADSAMYESKKIKGSYVTFA